MATEVKAGKVYFCLNHFHPGVAGGGSAPIDDETRVFVSDEPGCPTCPKCEKQVSAVELTDPNSLPPVVVAEVARRKNNIS
jgi:hypothetical protein